jgi:integrase
MAAMPALVRTRPGAPQRYADPPTSDEAVRARRASANRVLTMLKAALNFAFNEKQVASDSEWRRVKPFKGVETARVRYLAVSEAERLLNASAPDFRPLVRAALETGARYSELTRLEAADFNPDADTVTIRKSKASKSRHIVLTDAGAGFFREICAGRAGLIFGHADGSSWGASHQVRPIAEASHHAGIVPPINFHGLRHTWASHAVMNGVPLIVVAKNLGHKDTRMVEKHYGHLAEDYVSREIREKAPTFGTIGKNNVTDLDGHKRRA